MPPKKYSCFKNVEHEPEPFRPNFLFKEKAEMKKQAKRYYQQTIVTAFCGSLTWFLQYVNDMRKRGKGRMGTLLAKRDLKIYYSQMQCVNIL